MNETLSVHLKIVTFASFMWKKRDKTETLKCISIKRAHRDTIRTQTDMSHSTKGSFSSLECTEKLILKKMVKGIIIIINGMINIKGCVKMEKSSCRK